MTPDEQVDQWRLGARISHRAHYEAAKHYGRLHLTFGIPLLIISAALGTTVFANLRHFDIAWVTVALAALSVLMIVLSSLQTFLKYSERSERHMTAAVRMGEVRRQMEQALAFRATISLNPATVDVLREQWNSVDRQAPAIPTRIYDRVQRRIVEEERKRQLDLGSVS